MLIASPRHTERDLAAWADAERVDAVHCQHTGLARKVARAGDEVATFAAAGPCYLGVSWGKDSVVLAHLAHTLHLAVPLVWVRIGAPDNPDCPAVRDAFLARFPCQYHEIETACPMNAGLGIGTGRLRDGFRTAANRFGDRYISGVRGDESAARLLRRKHWGVSTPRTCAPLSYWTSADVFAYLFAHNLPVHPAYACTEGGVWERNRLRVASIGGERGTGHGRTEWERRYYPR